MSLLTFDLVLYEKFKDNPASFIGNIIDISAAPDMFSSCFNTEIAASHDISPEKLSSFALEHNLQKFTINAGLKFTSLIKEQVISDSKLLDSLSASGILVLK